MGPVGIKMAGKAGLKNMKRGESVLNFRLKIARPKTYLEMTCQCWKLSGNTAASLFVERLQTHIQRGNFLCGWKRRAFAKRSVKPVSICTRGARVKVFLVYFHFFEKKYYVFYTKIMTKPLTFWKVYVIMRGARVSLRDFFVSPVRWKHLEKPNGKVFRKVLSEPRRAIL